MFAYVKFEDGYKMIVKTSDIKHFKAECVNRSKKYKVRWEDDTFYDALIIDVRDSKQKLEEKLASKRPQIPVFDNCQSASESELESNTNDKASITDKIEKRLTRINSDCKNNKPLENIDVITKKDTREVNKKDTREVNIKNVTIKSNVILKTNNSHNILPPMDQNIKEKIESKKKVPAATKTTISMEKKNITTKKCNETTKMTGSKVVDKNNTIKENELHVAALKKQIHDLKPQNDLLRSANVKMKKTIKDKENILNDVMQLNMSLQKHIIDDFGELKAIVVDLCKKNAEKGQTNPGELPVGYRSVEKNLMYFGHDVWITNCQYDSIAAISKSCAMFVKNMAIAVFGTAVLKSSSVTGTQSNRIKNKTKKEPRPKLDPAKLLAVRDTLRYWLTNEKGYDEVAIEFELQQVGTHISHKIYELNRVPSGKRAVHNHPEDIETENDDSVAKYCETDVSAEEDHDHDDPLEDRSEINSESAIEDKKKDEEHTV